jgi:hypothetical protein
MQQHRPETERDQLRSARMHDAPVFRRKRGKRREDRRAGDKACSGRIRSIPKAMLKHF